MDESHGLQLQQIHEEAKEHGLGEQAIGEI
jgi:hypothetical protein